MNKIYSPFYFEETIFDMKRDILNKYSDINITNIHDIYFYIYSFIKKFNKNELLLIMNEAVKLNKNVVNIDNKLYKLKELIGNVNITDIENLKNCTGNRKICYDNNDKDCNMNYKTLKHINSGNFGTTHLVEVDNSIQLLKMEKIYADNIFKACVFINKTFDEYENMKKAGKYNISPKPYNIYYYFNKDTLYLESYLFMEYIDSITLREWIKNNVLTTKQIQKIIANVNKLHKLTIVHNDLHDENILVTKEKPHKFIIIDFGLSENYKKSTNKEINLLVNNLNTNFSKQGSKRRPPATVEFIEKLNLNKKEMIEKIAINLLFHLTK